VVKPQLWLLAAALLAASGCAAPEAGPPAPSASSSAVSSSSPPAQSTATPSASATVGPGGLSLDTARVGHTATLLKDGTVLVAGGAGSQAAAVALDTALRFLPSTREWKPAGKMKTGREFHTATLLADGRVLVTGGQGAGGDVRSSVPEGTPLASAELYDPQVNGWSAAAPMRQPREAHTATRLKSGKVLVVGGWGEATAELYDPLTDSWSFTGAPRLTTFGRGQTATLLKDGRVLLAPGLTSDGMPFGPTSIYNPSTDSWTQAAAMTWGRTSATGALLLPGGDVMVVGASAAGVKGATAERYHPASNSWSAILSDTNDTRYNFWTTVAMPDGRALGLPDQGQRPAKVYDPGSGSWSESHPLNGDRSYGYTATGLSNGLVLLTGGLDGQGNPLSAVELYAP
jgi:hypothetical protein